jgi:hypothetical protein
VSLTALAFLDEIMARPPGASMPAVAVRDATTPPTRRRGATPLDGAASPKERKLARKNTARKGRARQLLVRDYFKGQGYAVEIANAKVFWIPNPNPAGKPARIPITKHHDFFGLWDLFVVGHGKRFLVQVGSFSDVSTKRSAILDAGFPATAEDCIFGHEIGRKFRVLRGPLFETGSERIEVPK